MSRLELPFAQLRWTLPVCRQDRQGQLVLLVRQDRPVLPDLQVLLVVRLALLARLALLDLKVRKALQAQLALPV